MPLIRTTNEKSPPVIRITNMTKPTASTLLNRLLGRGKLRHLQVVLLLAELGSTQRTSQAIGMTQSAVTQTLAYLEHLLDTPLFIRHSRGMLPTSACLELLPSFRQLMLGVSQSAEILAASQQDGRHTLRLLASVSAIQGLLVTGLGLFLAQHADIRIELSEAEGEDLLLAMARGETDLVVCRRPVVIPSGWEFTTLMPDQFVVVASPHDDLIDHGSCGWSQLQHRQWLLSTIQTQARQRFEALCMQAGFSPLLFPVVTRVLSVSEQLIRTHQLLGFMPMSFVSPLLSEGRLCALAVEEDLDMAPIGLLKPVSDTRESAERFGKFLTALADDHPSARAVIRR